MARLLHGDDAILRKPHLTGCDPVSAGPALVSLTPPSP